MAGGALRYRSTRSGAAPVPSARALLEGLAPDGGLYLPERLPPLDPRVLSEEPLSYPELAYLVLRPWFPDLPEEGLRAALRASASRFETEEVAPLVSRGGFHFLELFRGPTLAFKDLALTLLGDLFALAAVAEAGAGGRSEDAVPPAGLRTAASAAAGGPSGAPGGEDILVLVATSGDTGKAALEGLAGRPGVRVAVFYPSEGVSPVQRLQMTSHAAANAYVAAIRGNFDDAQAGVKALFAEAADPSSPFARGLAARRLRLSSANSINVGRLAPQLVYWVKAWRDLRARGLLGPSGGMDVAVPTGNFGDILAAWYAKRAGLPIGTLLSASNRNRVLADFFRTGVYDRARPFYRTESPSMDILVSSNLERLLFHATGEDPARTAALAASLASRGRFELQGAERDRIGDFRGAWADEAEAAAAARRLHEASGYVVDPHTAVALAAASSLAGADPVVVAATASPFKFPVTTARALGLDLGAAAAPAGGAMASGAAGGAADAKVAGAAGGSCADPAAELDAAEALSRAAGLPLPAALRDLRGKPAVHGDLLEPGDMRAAVLAFATKELP